MKINLDVILNKLSKEEQAEAKRRNIDTLEKLLPLLLQRVSTENVADLAKLLKQSILPSICLEKDLEIEELFTKLEKTPELLFDKTIQNIIAEFINKRFERDKQIVIQRTSDIYKFVTLMGQYLNDAITSSGSGTQNVLNIKEKIQTMDLSNDGLKELSLLQTELVNAASLIETEMNAVSEKLYSGKTKVQELEEKVKELEQELNESKKESMIDHLTGALTRRAYDEEMKRIESSFQRYQT